LRIIHREPEGVRAALRGGWVLGEVGWGVMDWIGNGIGRIGGVVMLGELGGFWGSKGSSRADIY